jgi:glycosyltransferase involved in cell wall biosynthesis
VQTEPVLDLSLVIPMRDEEPNVEPLHQELVHVLGSIGTAYEIIFIDDGSVDRTFEELKAIAARDPRARVIRFTRNFGQTAAFAAGFVHARGRFIITSDGDLQNDPADIPRLLGLARTHDIVCGWRKRRKDNYLTRHLPSAAANWLIGLVTGIRLHDNGCSLKVFRAEVVKYGLSRTFGVIADLINLRRLMREAVDPGREVPRLYEIAELVESPGLHS